MQTLFLAFLISFTFSTYCLAANGSDTELEKKYSTELSSQTQIDKLTNELSQFAEKKKLKPSDKPALVQALKNVLILENIDPSRDGTLGLSDSYIENKKQYQAAVKSFTKDEQKKLNEIFKVLEDVNNRTGND